MEFSAIFDSSDWVSIRLQWQIRHSFNILVKPVHPTELLDYASTMLTHHLLGMPFPFWHTDALVSNYNIPN
jgi:hypothetical protein